jgi:hypothetical protein
VASQVDDGAVLNLEEHGRRLLTRWSERILGLDLEDERGLRARVVQDEVKRALYGHLCEALEAWQNPQHPGGAIDPWSSA